MGKNEDLSKQDREIIKGVAEGKSLKEIGETVLPQARFPSQATYRRLNKPAVKAKLAELMEQMGLDDGSLVKVHRQMLKAKKTKAVRVIGTRVKKEIQEPDWDARGRAIDLAYRAKGLYREGGEGLGIIINLIPPGSVARDAQFQQVVIEAEEVEEEAKNEE